MKRLKIFTMILISVLLVLLVGNVVLGWARGTEATLNNNGQIYVPYNMTVFGGYKNLYCIQPGQNISSATYTKRSTVQIIGNQTIVKDINENEIYNGANSYGNKMAACLYLDTIDNLEGYGEYCYYGAGVYKYWSAGQLALWQYWPTWRNELSADAQEVIPAASSAYGYMDLTKSALSVVESYVATNNYSVEFHILTSQGGDQRLILLEKTDLDNNPISIPVTKVWEDNNNQDGKRPDSITVQLLANGEVVEGKVLTLNASNNWKGTFTGLPKTKDDKDIKYTIKEVGVSKYTTLISPNEIVTTSESEDTIEGFTITNTHELEKIKLKIVKDWNDDNDIDGKRTEAVTVAITKNGKTYKNDIKLTSNNNWTYTSEELDKYQNGELIEYGVQEISVPEGYTETVTNSADINKIVTYTVKNTHKPETINIPVTKNWEDGNNSHGDRPTEVEVTLKYSNGEKVTTNADGKEIENPVRLNASNSWKYTFNNLNKYEKQGQEIQYTVEEAQVDNYEEPVVTGNQSGFTITNTHKPDGYIEISGKVWQDMPDGKANDINGKLDDDESGISGIKVTLKDANGKQFDATSTAVTSEDGTYTIKVNYDNSKNVYKLYEDSNTVKAKLNTAYVEFEYDGIQYTTVSTAKSGVDTSKAIENERTRNSIDSTHSMVMPSTKHPDEWIDTTITASTKNIISFENYEDTTATKKEVTLKYCNGDGTYIRTNPNGAWNQPETGQDNSTCTSGKGHDITKYSVDVEQIQNVNLGLFKREQPDVAIFSDLSKVEVTMNGQKYTYLYNIRSNAEENNVGLKAKFQNKNTYTYRRPVNPADIAYIQEEAHQNAMSVLVTYNVKVGNLSSTLPITVHNITNYYDSRYTLNSEGWISTSGTQFNQATYNGDLNITVDPLSESKALELTYTVSVDAIKALLKEDATLNNAVEIQSYSTKYGKDTLYAEQNSGGRTGNPYGGYDYNSHPGNAGIFINDKGRLEATKPEDDTDIAPSFVLCKDNENRILSGTVWEDTDIDNGSGPDNFRLGDGKLTDTDGNKMVENVKVELYKVNDNGSKELANLYKTNGEKAQAIVYTDSNGYYSFGNEEYSVVTDTYIIKFTYGDGIEKGDSIISTKIGETTVNARNYKSTIISKDNVNVYNMFKKTSMNDYQWHLNTTKGYSIAVDDMEQRVNIPDLQYSNFNNTINMTAYSKPFKMQIEYDPSEAKEASVTVDGDTTFGKELNIFDFGIIERAREDIFVETSVEYVRITLANGQLLTEGNPNGEMNFVKAVGLNQTISKGSEALNSIEKQILMEMDAELIQGAQLDVKYAIKVTNNSERDYDSYDEETSTYRTEYYYFGTNVENAPETVGSVNYIVDYLDAELNYSWGETEGWSKITAEDLYSKGLISQNTVTEINKSGYVAYITDKFKNLACGQTSETDYITASKLLANQDENTYDNHAEILQIDTKTARTLKKYKSGNYVPSLATRTKDVDGNNKDEAGLHQQDDDRIKVTITPPTGVTNYITSYIIVVLAGLIVIVIGLVFIKKKVLTK